MLEDDPKNVGFANQIEVGQINAHPTQSNSSLSNHTSTFLYGNDTETTNFGYQGNNISNNDHYANVNSTNTAPNLAPDYSINKAQSSKYLPRNLEPLLSFPINDESNRMPNQQSALNVNNDSDKNDDDGVSNENGRHTRLLSDSGGNMRYIGESSPLSLLFECRTIFVEYLGHSTFTDDPRRMSIIDAPQMQASGIPVQLPRREECDTLVKVFEENINRTFYVFDMIYFEKQIVDYIYNNPIKAHNHKLSLLHLVLSLGSLFAESTPEHSFKDYNDAATYFESGFTLMNNSGNNGSLWITEAYFLVYFYYQSTCKRSTSWLMLNMAIKNAQALGIHRKYINESFGDKGYIRHRRRLWLSLYICDRISSILLGRPLGIGDYDCDDFESTMPQGPIQSDDEFSALCQVEMAKVVKINGKIVKNFYGDGVINLNRARKLAIELKKWSINLRSEVQLDKFLKPDCTLKHELCFPLLLVHISQLYGIVLLTRPFFMYASFHKYNDQNRVRNDNLLVNFRNACIKASILTIKFINFFLSKYSKRIELYTTINCCFNAALILGLQLVYEKKNESQGNGTEYSVPLLMGILDIASNILSSYGMICITSKRFSDIVKSIQVSLRDKFSVQSFEGLQKFKTPAETLNIVPETSNNTEDKYFANTSNTPNFNGAPELNTLMDFQQFFLPPDSTSPSVTDMSDKHESFELFMNNLGKNDLLFDNKF